MRPNLRANVRGKKPPNSRGNGRANANARGCGKRPRRRANGCGNARGNEFRPLRPNCRAGGRRNERAFGRLNVRRKSRRSIRARHGLRGPPNVRIARNPKRPRRRAGENRHRGSLRANRSPRRKLRPRAFPRLPRATAAKPPCASLRDRVWTIPNAAFARQPPNPEGRPKTCRRLFPKNNRNAKSSWNAVSFFMAFFSTF